MQCFIHILERHYNSAIYTVCGTRVNYSTCHVGAML